jgi:hypothetical protein
MREGSEQVEEALYKLELCTDHLALFTRPRGRCISKKRLSQPQSPHSTPLSCHHQCPPSPHSPPLSHLHLHQCHAQFTALCPSPSPSLFPLSCVLCLHSWPFLHPPLPLFPPRMSHSHLHSWWHVFLPPLAHSLMFAFANTTTSLPPPLFAFMAGPLPQSHVHNPPIVTPLVIAHDWPPRICVHDRARVALARETLAFACAKGYLSGM